MSIPKHTTTQPPCRASVIIPSHNRCDDLCALLDSLNPGELQSKGVEVIIVDDCSTDTTAETIRERYPQVALLVNDKHQGPAYGRNRGARAACGTLFLYLDSDGVVDAEWLDNMLAADDGETVLLGCAVDYEGGRVQSLPRRATFLGKSVLCRPDRANSGPSCNLGVPRACFEAIGGFDEDIPYYFEDSDFCIRARRAGFSFKYLPGARFRHKGVERKQGEAIRHQEHNSTFAMLKAYRRAPLKWAAFAALNSVWLLVRLLAWSAQGRMGDALLLARGGLSAYPRFWRWRAASDNTPSAEN